jgi:Spy/CpxP family protein refolding chaperone
MKAIYSTFLMLAAAALLALSAPVPAFSQMTDKPMKEHRGRHGQMKGMGHMDMMGDMMGMCIEHADKIGLTNDQILKMKPIQGEMQKNKALFKADLKIAQRELMAIMGVRIFDLEKASASVKKIADIKTAHHLEMLKAMKEMRAILKDEQFEKMKDRMSIHTGADKPEKSIKKQ